MSKIAPVNSQNQLSFTGNKNLRQLLSVAMQPAELDKVILRTKEQIKPQQRVKNFITNLFSGKLIKEIYNARNKVERALIIENFRNGLPLDFESMVLKNSTHL